MHAKQNNNERIRNVGLATMNPPPRPLVRQSPALTAKPTPNRERLFHFILTLVLHNSVPARLGWRGLHVGIHEAEPLLYIYTLPPF